MTRGKVARDERETDDEVEERHKLLVVRDERVAGGRYPKLDALIRRYGVEGQEEQ